jgi:hypothetical protein
MKKVMIAVGLLAGLGLVVSLVVFAQGTGGQMVVKADGAALWDYLKKESYAQTWRMWPGKSAFYPGGEPHGALLTTYVNRTALAAIRGKKGALPDGSIIAKQNYTPDRKLAALTVMYKVKGYSPLAGDWFWAKYGPDGKIAAQGKVVACINCHVAKRDNDFIMTAPLK